MNLWRAEKGESHLLLFFADLFIIVFAYWSLEWVILLSFLLENTCPLAYFLAFNML